MNTPVPPEALERIKTALFEGKKIEAIKIYRQQTGQGLAESKAAVDQMEAELRQTTPERFLVPAGGHGCSATASAVVLIILLVILMTLGV